MSRASRYLRNCILALAFWTVLVFSRAAFVPEKFHLLLFALPVIAVIVFGAYAGANVLFHLITFKECPQAFIELQKEIKEAKTDLKKRGIKIN